MLVIRDCFEDVLCVFVSLCLQYLCLLWLISVALIEVQLWSETMLWGCAVCVCVSMSTILMSVMTHQCYLNLSPIIYMLCCFRSWNRIWSSANRWIFMHSHQIKHKHPFTQCTRPLLSQKYSTLQFTEVAAWACSIFSMSCIIEIWISLYNR